MMTYFRIALIVLFIPLASSGQSFYLDDTKGKIAYHLYGEGEYVLLLTGGPGNDYRQLEEVAITLSKTYSVILPEQRGTGKSIPIRLDSITINVRTLTDDIKLLMDYIGIKRAILVGHSWGGMLAMSFASHYPERVKALCLISPGPYSDWGKNVKTIQYNFLARLGKTELNNFTTLSTKIQNKMADRGDSIHFRKLARLAYIFDKNQLDSLFSKIDVQIYPTMQQLMLQDMQRNFDLSTSLFQYNGPIDVICGQQDILAFCAYELKILNRSVNLHWIDRCGHFPMFEKPDEFYDVLLNTLKKH